MGLKIGIITARKCYKNIPDSITIDWLEKHRLRTDWVEIVEGDKHLVIKARAVNCLLFLNDDPQHLLSVSNAKVSEYVGTLTYPWARELPREVLVFKNLNEISVFIKNLYPDRALDNRNRRSP